ncbi:hypothetical protein BDP27DRAFT_1362041 [Rhodocollybia butyracea]|uniref:Uncharacterized protein n=1 Tax=Rhodocollybia butyracea TaxID=206335 RepID=A0A9P5PS46_9AGAR|nr:hypothetical protein BDP27DRAFT_1362041 [Rhodocollybia butyracea]
MPTPPQPPVPPQAPAPLSGAKKRLRTIVPAPPPARPQLPSLSKFLSDIGHHPIGSGASPNAPGAPGTDRIASSTSKKERKYRATMLLVNIADQDLEKALEEIKFTEFPEAVTVGTHTKNKVGSNNIDYINDVRNDEVGDGTTIFVIQGGDCGGDWLACIAWHKVTTTTTPTGKERKTTTFSVYKIPRPPPNPATMHSSAPNPKRLPEQKNQRDPYPELDTKFWKIFSLTKFQEGWPELKEQIKLYKGGEQQRNENRWKQFESEREDIRGRKKVKIA